MIVLFVFKNSDGAVQIREAEGEKLFMYSINSFSQYFFKYPDVHRTTYISM